MRAPAEISEPESPIQMRIHAQVLRASTELLGLDLFGQVKQGPSTYLLISGPVVSNIRIPLKTATGYNGRSITYRGHSLWIISVYIDDPDNASNRCISIASDLSLLVIDYLPNKWLHEALILKSTASGQNEFERIGSLTIFGRENVVETIPREIVRIV